MEDQKFEELRTTMRHLSQENARLYEACFEESKKLKDFANRSEENQKRIDELDKMLSNYENELRMLIKGREKLPEDIESTGRLLSDHQEKETKRGEGLVEPRDIESNAELMEARKKLIDILQTLSSSNVETVDIGVKNLGQVNFTAFHEEMVRASGQSMDIVFDVASDICREWEDKIKNPLWHPFKVVMVEGKTVELIDDNDKDLKALLNDMGEEVYKAVTTALTEMNENNQKGHRNVVSELWNFREERKATLKEGIAFVAERYLGQYVQDSIGYSEEGPQNAMAEKGVFEMDMSP